MRPLVTDIDNTRLRGLMTTPAGRRGDRGMWLLVEKLNRARIVPAAQMPPTIVTMNSRVACWEKDSGAARELSLVYPWNGAPSRGRVSILSRAGVELLGAMPGHVVELDAGRRVQIAYVAYQPEAERQLQL